MDVSQQCFYKGQKVKSQELNDLQNYADNGQSNLVNALLGYGIVNGFEVSHIDQFLLGVTSGLAFNLQGERLVLSESKQVNLMKHAPNVGEKTIKLGVVLDYEKTEPTLDSMGDTVYKKWTPTVQFITTDSSVGFVEENRTAFELAEIKINPLSVVEINYTAPSFDTLPRVQQSLEQLYQKTSVLTTGEDGAMLSNPLINLITQNLQINGTPYMEIGSNGNGHYVKFENGLLVCFKLIGSNNNTYTWVFPHSFVTFSVLLVGDNELNEVRENQNISKIKTTSIPLKDFGSGGVYGYCTAIGFWK